MVGVEEIVGWSVAGTVTLVGVLVASHLAERNRRQLAHFEKVKSLAIAPVSSWIANLRPLPHVLTPTKAGFKPASEPFTTFEAPELACVRTVHFPDLVREWDALYRDYVSFTNRAIEWAQSVETRIAEAVGGVRVSGHREPSQFTGYREELVVAVLEGLTHRTQSIPLGTGKWTLDPASLDGRIDPSKEYLWLTVHGTTVINLLVGRDRDRDEVLDGLRAGLALVMSDAALRERTAELLAEDEAIQNRMTAFKSRLARILNLDETLPGTCESVEPRWYFRVLTLLWRR